VDLDGNGTFETSGVTATFRSTQDGTFTVRLRVTDNDQATGVATALVTVVNVAPTAEAGGPYNGYTGQDIRLDAAGSTDPGLDIASYQWDLNGDGQYDDAAGKIAFFRSATVGVFTVGVRV